MKVGILAPSKVIPPLTGGARRAFEIAEGLSDMGVSVILIHAGAAEKSLLPHRMREIGFLALEDFSLTKHFVWSRALDSYFSLFNVALLTRLIRLVKKAELDLLQIEGPWSICSVKLVNAFSGKLPLVYDAHNVERESIKYSSGVSWIWPFATLLEKEAVRYSDVVFCVSELDRARMCRLYDVPPEKIVIIPNGVCSLRYKAGCGFQMRKRLGLGENNNIVFFHGDLRWRPNTEAAQTIIDSIAPHFERGSPETVFLIAGFSPPSKLIVQAEQQSNVRVLGYVSAIEEYIGAADVCIAPLKRGSGTKLKILEYLAAGKPVVATRKAVEGMGIKNGVEALICDDVDDEFILALRKALSSNFSQRLGGRARIFARRFDWSMSIKEIVEVYNSILNQQPQ